MLFENTKQLSEYVELNQNTSWKLIKPSLAQAAREYLQPALSQEFLEELEALAAAPPAEPTPDQTKQLKALEKARTALANYAVFLFVPKGAVQFGESGVTETNAQNVTAARQWVVNSAQRALVRAADSALEDLLEYLEKNKTAFATWAASEAYTVSQKLFVKNAATLAEWQNITNSRRTYQAVRPYLQRAERSLKNLTGAALFTKLKGAELSDAEKELIAEYINPVLVPMAVALWIPEGAVDISHEGISFKSWANGIEKADQASENAKMVLQRSLETAAEAALARLKKHLFDQAETFTDFKTSETYLNRQSGGNNLDCTGKTYVLV